MRMPALWVVAGLWILGAPAGCGPSRALHRGPDVVKVPEGFVHVSNADAARNLFPERPKLLERTYMTAAIADDDHSSISITQYAGPTTADEVEAAVNAERERYGHADYGPIESLTIDRRPGWGWLETQPKGAPEITAMNYRAVVSTPGASYLVEFYTTHRRFLDPARLEEVVASFVAND